MNQVAELLVAERIVAHVLHECAFVGVGVRLAHLVVGEAGIAGQDHGAQVVVPEEIDDLLVRENGIRVRETAGKEKGEKDCGGSRSGTQEGLDRGGRI